MICDASSSVLVTVEIYESSVPASLYSQAKHGCDDYCYRHEDGRLCWNRRYSPRKLLSARLSPSSDPYSPCVIVLPSRMILPKVQPDLLVQDLRLEFLHLSFRFYSFDRWFRLVFCERKKLLLMLAYCQHVISWHSSVNQTDFFCCSIMLDKNWLCVFASCNDVLMSCKSFSRSSTCRGVTLTHTGLFCKCNLNY